MGLNKVCRDLLQSVIRKENVVEASFKISSASKPGDGYLGIHVLVKIIGKNKILSLFVKIAPDDEEFRKQEPIRQFYLNESLFYNLIYPTFLQFQREKHCEKIFNSIAKCYKTNNSELRETIVLENLLEGGYRLLDRKKPMPKNHIEMILREYGHLHALSFALKDQNRRLFDEISANTYMAFDHYTIRDDFQKLFRYLTDTAKKSLIDVEDEKIRDVFDKFSGEILPFLNIVKTLTSNEYSVITHGDGWCNNFMFKYEDTNNPTNPTTMRFLDWQMMRVAPPVFDVSYFFYSSCTKEDMDNLDYFLQLYHASLASNMKMLGSEPERIYSYCKLKEQWKIYGRYGLILSLLVLKVALTESNEVELIDEVAAKRKNISETFIFEIKNDKLYKERIRDVIVHFAKNGFLELLNIVM